MKKWKKILIAVVVAVVVVAGVLLWSWWRRGVTAEQEAASNAPQTQQTPEPEAEDEPDTEPDVPSSQVRDHAEQLSQQMSQLSSYTVPGDQYSTYELIARNGKFDTTGLTDDENVLRDALNESMQWTDSHTSDENRQQIALLDSAYEDWSERLWETMCDCLSDTVDGLDGQLHDMDTEGLADSCVNVKGMAGSAPEPGSDEQSYTAMRDWMNSAVDGMNQCQADMVSMYAGQ